jgi:nucleoid DNA-binding protein
MVAKNNSSTNNAFIRLQESASGRVSVRLQKNHFAKDGSENFWGKVDRYTYSTQNILDAMAESVPLVDLGTVTSVLNAYANTVLKILASGNAVKFGELGTFYIAGKGTVDGTTGKPALTVKFSATPVLKDAVQKVEIASSEYVEPSGTISGITDITTGKSDGTLISGSSVLMEGSNLKIGGKDSGIWFAPAAESGNPVEDESQWVKVESALIYNLPSKLLFALPKNLESGRYRIVVRTRYAGKKEYERKYFVEALSEIV